MPGQGVADGPPDDHFAVEIAQFDVHRRNPHALQADDDDDAARLRLCAGCAGGCRVPSHPIRCKVCRRRVVTGDRKREKATKKQKTACVYPTRTSDRHEGPVIHTDRRVTPAAEQRNLIPTDMIAPPMTRRTVAGSGAV